MNIKQICAKFESLPAVSMSQPKCIVSLYCGYCMIQLKHSCENISSLQSPAIKRVNTRLEVSINCERSSWIFIKDNRELLDFNSRCIIRQHGMLNVGKCPFIVIGLTIIARLERISFLPHGNQFISLAGHKQDLAGLISWRFRSFVPVCLYLARIQNRKLGFISDLA